MMAIIGMFFQDGLTGSAWGDWSLYTESPLRSTGLFSPGYNTLPEWEKPKNGFEGLVGDQPPLGFWDPAGYAKDGNVENFKRRREVELKHGRVAMFATIGYIVPEYFKFDGECSPSEGLKFADIPNGLKALGVVPVAGWAQILAFAGFIELAVNKPTGEPGNYGKGFLSLGTLGLGSSIQDPEVRVKKLAAEISNGRLAMFAIIGMFFQDGLTGSAWGDWALYTDSPLRAFESELGVQAPVGFFDPFGMTKDGDVETFKRRRATELKNGRVAMLAAMGYITPEYFRFPGVCATGVKFSEIPNGLGALEKVPGAGWVQIILFLGLVEKSLYTHDPTRAPGDFKNGGVLGVPNGSTMMEGEARTKKLNAELANGRLAMMAITGMWFQDGLTGSAWGDWSLYVDSPLRAFENELGVQAPVGFWDPIGFTADGDVEAFKRRRATELKHGRISMLACMGYMTPEIIGNFPGYLSPSTGLKYADIPNGLGAISKVPWEGWFQMVFYCLFVEYKSGFGKDWKEGTPGDLGWKMLTASDPEEKQRKLQAEIANSRLAMTAIMAMFFQNGTVGTTGPEMWIGKAPVPGSAW